MSVLADIIGRKYLITILMQVVYYCICLNTVQVSSSFQVKMSHEWKKKKCERIISSLNLKPQF